MIETVISTLLSGIVLGALYALMASGLSMIWTTLGVFNFTHGALMMIGAFMAWTVSEAIGLGIYAGLVAGIGATALLGVIIEYMVIRPFHGRANMILITVMTTLAVMIILEKSAQMIWGPRLKQLPRLIEGDVSIFGAVISAHEALIVVLAPVILIALWVFATRTMVGRSLRAVGQNQDAAALLGINVPLTFAIAFGLGAALAGLTGVLLGGIRFVTPNLGVEPIIKAMTVVIFGGLGSLGATVGAAFVIGFAEAFLILVVGLYWTPFALFIGLILVLIFRPNGLFGRA
ncbi:MAG: branched-chain amino acid ABC transporter permease [Roseovarius sp.]|nr:branched-chain amino acid ABC transporter permease [Roseovarius sp.]MCY4208835.1 branched-chain amino acid ABC transporter permease [Roseovarius sp.]MCY4291214.1 branched-chain amino acid ABC transporter permease [Roseovarius sp.]MCY4315846.1 branched-chain amino acid ABC transporter permease [Roseovarius sp.]